MSRKALVLSSGGIDSTTCLALAVEQLGAANVAAVSIYYGQRHRVELDAARAVAEYYRVRHYEFDLSTVMRFSNLLILRSRTSPRKRYSFSTAVAHWRNFTPRIELTR